MGITDRPFIKINGCYAMVPAFSSFQSYDSMDLAYVLVAVAFIGTIRVK